MELGIAVIGALCAFSIALWGYIWTRILDPWARYNQRKRTVGR